MVGKHDGIVLGTSADFTLYSTLVHLNVVVEVGGCLFRFSTGKADHIRGKHGLHNLWKLRVQILVVCFQLVRAENSLLA